MEGVRVPLARTSHQDSQTYRCNRFKAPAWCGLRRGFRSVGILPAVLHSVVHRKSAGETPALRNPARRHRR